MSRVTDAIPAASCRRCPRLARHRREVARRWPEHFGAPVPAWGPADSDVLIVGLAPGLHGAHRTGIPFFGDASGKLLTAALKASGFATPEGNPGAPVRITNAVKCLPPGNQPQTSEISRCQPFLKAELSHLAGPGGIIFCLGGVAHRAVVRALGLSQSTLPFGHGASYRLDCGRRLLSSYHPSRLNVNTGRLTQAGFFEIVGSLR